MPGRRRTPAEIENFVTQFRTSGLSRRDFAYRHDFSVGSLARWLQRQPTPPTPPSWFELTLPDGRRLRIYLAAGPTDMRKSFDTLAAGTSCVTMTATELAAPWGDALRAPRR